MKSRSSLEPFTEAPAKRCDSIEKRDTHEMKRKPEETLDALQEQGVPTEEPREQGVPTEEPRERGIPTEEPRERGIPTEKNESPRERGVGKRSVPTEKNESPRERGVGKRSVPTEKNESSRERGVGKRSVPTEKNESSRERGVGKRSVPTQGHGFSLEKEIMRMIYHMTEEELHSIPYTSKVDIPAELNRLDHCDVSIKTTGHPNMVCMADCLRVYDSVRSGKPLHMIVIHYIQETNIKKITSIIEIDLTDSCEALFGSLTRSEIERLDRAVKAIPQKKKPTEEERKSMYEIRDSLQTRSGAIHLDIKCNSTQSRLQCSFNHFQRFIENDPSRIIAKSNTNEFRGGVLSPQMVSSRRTFKPKGKVHRGSECLQERGVGSAGLV